MVQNLSLLVIPISQKSIGSTSQNQARVFCFRQAEKGTVTQ
jgi:hypothetical protein